MADLYSIAGLNGPGGKPAAAAEPRAAAAPQLASSEAPKRVLGSAPWSALSDHSKRFAPPVLKRAAPGANKPKPASASSSAAAGAAACSAACKGSVAAHSTTSTSWYKDIKTPYDPAHPNDYDEWLREQEIKAKQRRLDEDLQRKLAERQQEDDEARRQRAAGPPPPPPPRPQAAPPPPPPPRQPAAPPPPLPEGFSAAGETGEPGIAMLQKMGWSEGQGLGKEGQGMKTPLVAKKMDSTTGVITNAEQRPLVRPPPPPPPPPAALAGVAAGVVPEAKKTGAVTFRGRPSRVLLMKNMVGPGEVDEDLVNEIGEECSKYGEVAKVSIFEVKDVADEEAVRIFVKFQKQAAAMKAYIEMDKRFFGGRQVWVCFFQEKDFDAGTLGPSSSEPR